MWPVALLILAGQDFDECPAVEAWPMRRICPFQLIGDQANGLGNPNAGAVESHLRAVPAALGQDTPKRPGGVRDRHGTRIANGIGRCGGVERRFLVAVVVAADYDGQS